MTKNVVMISLWRDDAERDLEARAEHLLSKKDVSKWLWLVGDSGDATELMLAQITWQHIDKKIEIIRADTGILGEDPETRVRRLSETITAGLRAVGEDDDYVVIHESDLQSPDDVVTRFIGSGKDVVAGWVTLEPQGIFYDTWGYRADGELFSNYPPYSHVYQRSAPFEVDSVGSCWMFPAEEAIHVMPQRFACVEMCHKLRLRGQTIWVDPTIPVVQPSERVFMARQHAEVRL